MKTQKLPLQVAVLQLVSVDKIEKNLQQIWELVKAAEKKSLQKISLFCLPENSIFMRLQDTDPVLTVDLGSEIFAPFQEYCKKQNTHFHFGSVPLKEGGVVWNASVFVTADKIISTYKKIHLFDISLEGHRPNRESDVFKNGSEPAVIECAGWHLGQTICYDLRFAELYHKYAQKEVDVLLVPSSFLVPTGRAHWEILLRARAIESQAYVIAAAQGGEHLCSTGKKRETFGHSMVIDPWGTIIAEQKEMGPGFLLCELKSEEVAKVRRQIPMKTHRRL